MLVSSGIPTSPKKGTLDDSDIAHLDVEARKLEKRRLQFGDIILEKSGGGPKQPVGRVALFDKTDGDFSFSNFTAALRVLEPHELDFRFLHKFLHWTYLSGVTEGMQSHSTGIRNLDGDAYKAIKITLPPLLEQHRIIGILDEALDGIAIAKANAKKNLQNARALFHVCLSSACTGELTKEWRYSHPHIQPGSATVPRILRERRRRWEQQRLTSYQSKGIEPPKDWKQKYESPAAADMRYLPKLPSTWAIISASEATHRLTYGITVRPKYVEDGIPIISGREIRSGEIDLDIANRISQHDFGGLREKCRLQLNDVLFGKTGTIGTVARVKTDTPLCVSQNVALLSPIIQPEYLELVLRSGVIQTMARKAIINAAIPDLQLRFLETFPIPIPPEEEQALIVKKFHILREECQRLESLYERKLAGLDTLKKSLMHQAFSGEL